MKSPFCLSIALLITACGTTPASHVKSREAVLAAGQVSFGGADGANLFLALQSTGVAARTLVGGGSTALGLLTLEVKSIACQAPSALQPEPTCTVVTSADTLKAPRADAAEILRILKANNADKASTNGSTVAAESLVCIHDAVPHAEYKCSYFTSIRS